jgi:ribokinase
MMDLVVRAPRLPVIGESLLSHSFRTSPGGKGGNQAIAAARLGASVTMIGQVGGDRFGEILRERLEAEGVDTRFVSVDPELGTGVAVPIVLDSGENAILAVPQANLALSSLLIERARDVISSAGMLLVQFEVNMDATLAAMRLAEAARVPILLNPAPVAPYPPGTLELASVIVANEIEAAALVPSASGDHDAEVEVLRRLSRSAVITLGHDGAVVDDGSGPQEHSAFRRPGGGLGWSGRRLLCRPRAFPL